jgi:hypothetical protein
VACQYSRQVLFERTPLELRRGRSERGREMELNRGTVVIVSERVIAGAEAITAAELHPPTTFWRDDTESFVERRTPIE